jgi:hypothetical protein
MVVQERNKEEEEKREGQEVETVVGGKEVEEVQLG